jgi:hypothetical protein
MGKPVFDCRAAHGFLQTGDEMGVARKPIELGNHQRGFVFLCDRQGLGKLRPLGIGLSAGLDLDLFADDLPAATVEESLNGRALRRHLNVLLARRNPVVEAAPDETFEAFRVRVRVAAEAEELTQIVFGGMPQGTRDCQE